LTVLFVVCSSTPRLLFLRRNHAVLLLSLAAANGCDDLRSCSIGSRDRLPRQPETLAPNRHAPHSETSDAVLRRAAAGGHHATADSAAHRAVASRGPSNATINRDLITLKRMFNLSMQSGKLMTRPDIPLLKETRVTGPLYRREEIDPSFRRATLCDNRPPVTRGACPAQFESIDEDRMRRPLVLVADLGAYGEPAPRDRCKG
jgi:hypothetical protein